MIDPKKEYRTRALGYEVRIYATDGGGVHPVHGAYFNGRQWCLCVWRSSGSYCFDTEPHDNDLIEVKPRIKREVWLNVYDDDAVIYAHPSKKVADRMASNYRPRKTCVHVVIDCEEGEGL